jgi:hypothetical protein
MVQWLQRDGYVSGCRVRQVGTMFIEIHKMTFNLRVVVTEALIAVDEVDFAPAGYAWCYPGELGYPQVSAFVWEWPFDPTRPGLINPPGPWIKAVHSQVYREPGIGQRGPV